MKKIKLITILIISMFLMMPVAFAVETGKYDISETECINFGSKFTNIDPKQSNIIYFNKCYMARCNSGQYGLMNRIAGAGYKCLNGNTNPYTKVTSDGCSSFKGACSKDNKWGSFCTSVTQVDCGKNANGTPYETPTQATTKAPVVTTAPTTTQKRTTTKATTKATTKKRTTLAPFSDTTKPTEAPTTVTTTEPPIPNNPNIKTIKINDKDIKYTKSKDTYTIKLPMDLTEVDVKVELEEPNDATQVVIAGNTEMTNEEREITIDVTAQGGATKKVVIKVKRYSGESSDCTLANIYLEDYDLGFDKNKYDYKLKVKSRVSYLDLQVLPTDEENAMVEILDNAGLKNNSKVSVKVRAQDGTQCLYTITVQKSNNLWKYVVLIVLLVGALVVASITLYKYMKKSKGKYKYE